LAFVEEIRQLKEGERSTRFRNLFKRYIEAMLTENKAPEGLVQLTPSQIEGRAVLSLVSEETILFGIERHGSFIPITYQFELSIKDTTVRLLSANPDYLTVAEFAERFELSWGKVRALIKMGRLKAVRASVLQDMWYELMVMSGRPSVCKPWDPAGLDFTPRNDYLIPFSEVERFVTDRSGQVVEGGPCPSRQDCPTGG
jgi:hypothetical protein